jgi:hypothetical protein
MKRGGGGRGKNNAGRRPATAGGVVKAGKKSCLIGGWLRPILRICLDGCLNLDGDVVHFESVSLDRATK